MSGLPHAGSGVPAPGEFLRDYEILGRIGAGGMGVVLKARDLKLQRVVALKFLQQVLFDGEADKQALLREARAISALDHPNICTLYGLEENTDGQLFMVMAYYDGGTLAGKIANGPVPMREALELLTGMISGVAAAHAQNILHRDIKPSNILLTRQNVPKLVDFGLAKSISSDSRTQSMTTSGTASYMAPEQLRGEAFDQRADIWAIGLTAAEMLSGYHPFRRETLLALAHSICNDPPNISGTVPLGLQRVIYKCLAKRPELRYANCAELLDDIAEVNLHEIPPTASPVRINATAMTATASWESRERSSKGSSQKNSFSRIIAAASSATEPKSSRQRWIISAVVAVLLVLLAGTSIPILREHIRGLFFGPKEKHIAVLAFDSASADRAMDPLADGLMDSMTAALSNLDTSQQSLWVIPSSVVRSRNITDPVMAYKQLGATLVVKGRLERTGQRVEIDLNLINAETLRQIGAVTGSSDNGNLAAAETDAVTQLGHLLNVSGGRDAVARSGSSNVPAAFDLYLEALSYLQRFDRPQNLDAAIDLLQKALAQDAEFALAYAKLGEAYRLKYKANRDALWMQEALANCERALKLNPQLPSAYVTLGSLQTLTGNNELALTEFQRAVALDSRNPDAIIGMAWSYEQAGRLQEAEAEYNRAAALNFSDWSNRNELALFYHRQARYTDAIEQVKQAIASSPDNPMLYFNLAGFYLDSGNPSTYPLAEEALRKSLAITVTNGAYSNLALLYLHEKRYAEAAAASEKAIGLDDHQILSWWYAELAYRWLGEGRKADAALNRVEKLAQAQAALNPRNPAIQSWLGLVYAREGLCDKAIPHLEAGLTLAPRDSQVLVNAIMAYNHCADEASAEELIQKAQQGGASLADLQLDPDMQSLLATERAR
jgi:eukaryotic-like serine/threonine-protein kinase